MPGSRIEEVRATFGFDGFSCDPAEISAALGIEPDEVRVKGQRRPLRGNPRLVVASSTWSISSSSPSKDINDHLRELFGRLERVSGPLPPEWGEPSFSVLWRGNYLYAGSGPSYERDVVARMAAHCAALCQDIYQVDRGDDATQDGEELMADE